MIHLAVAERAESLPAAVKPVTQHAHIRGEVEEAIVTGEHDVADFTDVLMGGDGTARQGHRCSPLAAPPALNNLNGDSRGPTIPLAEVAEAHKCSSLRQLVPVPGAVLPCTYPPYPGIRLRAVVDRPAVAVLFAELAMANVASAVGALDATMATRVSLAPLGRFPRLLRGPVVPRTPQMYPLNALAIPYLLVELGFRHPDDAAIVQADVDAAGGLALAGITGLIVRLVTASTHRLTCSPLLQRVLPDNVQAAHRAAPLVSHA